VLLLLVVVVLGGAVCSRSRSCTGDSLLLPVVVVVVAVGGLGLFGHSLLLLLVVLVAVEDAKNPVLLSLSAGGRSRVAVGASGASLGRAGGTLNSGHRPFRLMGASFGRLAHAASSRLLAGVTLLLQLLGLICAMSSSAGSGSTSTSGGRRNDIAVAGMRVVG